MDRDRWRAEIAQQMLELLQKARADAWDEGAAANWDGQDLKYPNPYREEDY